MKRKETLLTYGIIQAIGTYERNVRKVINSDGEKEDEILIIANRDNSMLLQAMVKIKILIETQDETEVRPLDDVGAIYILQMLHKARILIILPRHIIF